MGGVQFPVTGPLRYTMTAKDAIEIEREFAGAPEDIRQRIRWLPIGTAVDLAA